MPSLVTGGAPIVHATFFVLLLVAVGIALGALLLRALGVKSGVTVPEKAVLALALGVGALQFVPFFLGAVGQLSVNTLRIAFAFVALAVTPTGVRLFRSARAWMTSVRRPDGWLVWWGACLLPVLGVAAFLALTPTLDPDGLAYHLTAPKRWLASGTVGYLPTYFVTNAPMGVEMLFAIALSLDGDAAAKLLHFALGCSGAVGLYYAGSRCGGKVLGALAATLFLVGPFGVAPLLGCAYLEGVTSFAMIASSLAWIVWFRTREAPWLRTAALLAGIAVSFKLTSALFPVALGGVTLAVSWDSSRERRGAFVRVLRDLLPAALLIVVPVAPWLVRSAVLTGNPFFPLFAGLIPSRDYSPAMAAKSELYNRYLAWASQAGAAWSLALRKKILLGVGVGLAIAAGGACLLLRNFVARATALVLLFVALAQLASVGLYGRYWSPLLSVLVLPLLMPFARLWAQRWMPWAVLALTGVLSLVNVRRCLASVQGDVSGLVRTALGLENPRDFIVRHFPLYPAYEWANRELASDAHVLLANYCGGFYLDRITYCSEFMQDALRVQSFPMFAGDLLRLGVTHVLAPMSLAGDGPPPPLLQGTSAIMIRPEEDRVVSRLLHDYARFLHSAADQGLYAIDRDKLAAMSASD